MRPCWWSRTKAFLSSGNLTLFSCKFCAKKFYCFHPQHAALPRGCKLRIHVTSHVSQTPPFTRVEGAFQKSQEVGCRRFFSLPSHSLSHSLSPCLLPHRFLFRPRLSIRAPYFANHKRTPKNRQLWRLPQTMFQHAVFSESKIGPPSKKIPGSAPALLVRAVFT